MVLSKNRVSETREQCPDKDVVFLFQSFINEQKIAFLLSIGLARVWTPANTKHLFRSFINDLKLAFWLLKLAFWLLAFFFVHKNSGVNPENDVDFLIMNNLNPNFWFLSMETSGWILWQNLKIWTTGSVSKIRPTGTLLNVVAKPTCSSTTTTTTRKSCWSFH